MAESTAQGLADKGEHVVLSVPGARRLGVAGRTALYPALGIGAEGIRTLLQTTPHLPAMRECRRQILVVAENPDERHWNFLDSASRIGCPTLVVRWCDARFADVARLAAGLDPGLVQFADPRAAANGAGQPPISSALLVPARADLDRLLVSKFPSLRAPTVEQEVARNSSENWLTVIAANA
jgi:hypothetical protein